LYGFTQNSIILSRIGAFGNQAVDIITCGAIQPIGKALKEARAISSAQISSNLCSRGWEPRRPASEWVNSDQLLQLDAFIPALYTCRHLNSDD